MFAYSYSKPVPAATVDPRGQQLRPGMVDVTQEVMQDAATQGHTLRADSVDDFHDDASNEGMAGAPGEYMCHVGWRMFTPERLGGFSFHRHTDGAVTYYVCNRSTSPQTISGVARQS